MAGPATNSVSSAVRQLSDGNAVGTVLGQSSADPIGFFGLAAGVTQPTSPSQAIIPSTSGVGSAGAVVTQYTSTQSPSAVSTLTTAEQSATVTGVLATDLVIVNKPTAQAGLGVLSGRAAANAVYLTYANVTAGTLTPTGSEAYLVTTIPANLQISATLTPAAVAASTIVEQTFTVPGVPSGLVAIQANKPTTQAGLGLLGARVVSNNTVALTFINTTAGTLTPTAGQTYTFAALSPIQAASNVVNFGINVGTLSGVAANTTSEQSVTEAGIASGDVLVGMSKPTLQAGLLLGPGRVASTSAKIQFANVTAGTLTPTGSEVYNVTVWKSAPASVLSLITSVTLTPVSVAANTTAEQTFTVAGLTSGQPVIVNPTSNVSQLAGVGIAGARVSATNTLALTFINATSAAITPRRSRPRWPSSTRRPRRPATTCSLRFRRRRF